MARLDLRLGQHVPFLHLDQYAYARNGARQTGNNLQLFVSTLWAASSVSLWRFVGPVMSYRERGTQPYRWHVKEVCHHGTAVDSGAIPRYSQRSRGRMLRSVFRKGSCKGMDPSSRVTSDSPGSGLLALSCLWFESGCRRCCCSWKRGPNCSVAFRLELTGSVVPKPLWAGSCGALVGPEFTWA